MKRWGWLYALLGLLSGVALGRWLAWPRTRTGPQSAEVESRLPGDRQRLTRADVLRMIEENGGPQGLSLSGADLSGVDLSWMDLEEVCFRGAQLKQAVLSCCWLERCDFQDADLWRADLKGSSLWKANMDRADMKECDLRGAMLADVSLRDALLVGADLSDALFHRTVFSNTLVGRKEIGSSVLLEHLDDLLDYARAFDRKFERLQKKPNAEKWLLRQTHLKYAPARDAYLALKNNFSEIGRYDDASWAYIKERQMERVSRAPWRARQYHGQVHPLGVTKLPDYESLPQWHPMTWWFWCKYMVKWLLDWVTELACGYGERPLRTVVLAGIILALFPFVYWAVGGVGHYDPAMGRDVASLDFRSYIIYSAGAFATIGYEGLKPITTAAQIWTAVEAILGISILALLMFTLGNRISRS